MKTDVFWDLIAASKDASDGTFEGRAESLASRLSALAGQEVVDFKRIYDECMDRAYTWDLWGAAYVIGGGCSDDGFTDFRSWLISAGREIYEKALADPETLADVEFGADAEEDAFFEEFAYVPGQVYRKKTGDDLPARYRSHPSEPAGEEWEEEGDDLSRRYPRLWARYGAQ